MLGMNFISITSQGACPAVFPWTSLPRDTLSVLGGLAESLGTFCMQRSHPQALPNPTQLVFQGMLFPSPWDFAIQGHLELFTAQVLLLT